MEGRQRRESAWTTLERLEQLMQSVATCDAIQQREVEALRAQVHDLTQLLAAFDLCELRDVHLGVVRDRAFRRDMTPDHELLQVYRVERKLQVEALKETLEDEPTEQQRRAKRADEQRRVSEAYEALQQQVRALGVSVTVIRTRLDAAIATNAFTDRKQQHQVSGTAIDANTSRDDGSARTGHRARVERLVAQEELDTMQEHCERATRELRQQLEAACASPDEQRERIAELERSVADLTRRNTELDAALQQKTRELETMVDRLVALYR